MMRFDSGELGGDRPQYCLLTKYPKDPVLLSQSLSPNTCLNQVLRNLRERIELEL